MTSHTADSSVPCCCVYSAILGRSGMFPKHHNYSCNFKRKLQGCGVKKLIGSDLSPPSSHPASPSSHPSSLPASPFLSPDRKSVV